MLASINKMTITPAKVDDDGNIKTPSTAQVTFSFDPEGVDGLAFIAQVAGMLSREHVELTVGETQLGLQRADNMPQDQRRIKLEYEGEAAELDPHAVQSQLQTVGESHV
jgi:hypothetical protein